jgi:polyhydroxybutyrate depolymerase
MPVYAVEHDVDDCGFLRTVVADVQRRTAIDPARVFAAGHSNGAMMCHRLARQAPDVFAGIASVSGAMDFTEQDSITPIAVLIVHGTADEHVLYHGGAPRQGTGRAGDRTDASVQDAIDYYVARNGLRAYPDSQKDGKVRIDTYATPADGKPGTAPVRVITLEGGGHAWPGTAAKGRLLADAPFGFPATQAIWDFFAGVTRTTGPSPSVPR